MLSESRKNMTSTPNDTMFKQPFSERKQNEMNQIGESFNTKPFLSPNEFFLALNGSIGKNSLYTLIHSGRIKSLRVGRKILIPKSEITEFPEREAK